MSLVQFKETELKFLGKLSIWLFSTFGILYKREFIKDDEKYVLKRFTLREMSKAGCYRIELEFILSSLVFRWIEINNMTILNLILKFTGPLYEHQLANVFLGLQLFGSILAFIIRFHVARLFYEVVN